jgi:hypothetical protein
MDGGLYDEGELESGDPEIGRSDHPIIEEKSSAVGEERLPDGPTVR